MAEGEQTPTTPVEPAAAAPAEPESLLGGGEPEKPTGAPEKYEAFTFPEGAEVDEAKVGEFTTIAKEHNLTQEGAQKFLDIYTAEVQRQADEAQDAWAKVHEQWTKDSRADKEFGGAKFDESLGYARKVLQKYGTNELVEALKVTGMSNHPELVRIFSRIGRAVGEDNLGSGSPAQQPRDAAEVLFGGTTPT